MKITDYGLWLKPYYSDVLIKELIYFNGQCIGHYCDIYRSYFVQMVSLRDIGFTVKVDAPAIFWKGSWQFHPDYIPSESDFEEIP